MIQNNTAAHRPHKGSNSPVWAGRLPCSCFRLHTGAQVAANGARGTKGGSTVFITHTSVGQFQGHFPVWERAPLHVQMWNPLSPVYSTDRRYHLSKPHRDCEWLDRVSKVLTCKCLKDRGAKSRREWREGGREIECVPI